ncbi:MAG: thiopurine S-methyltransferase [Candidatus Competibacteraceae bacterium]|uniref:Thiopurine S-methyltransferase n=1 Tax=Candidatus Contendobacter odensis Run_B_J11 TaxID=1400861 RepID=A0A7U7G9V7_9GAMM|nr:thiopurine S-methyltransferase [Candidatus Contendobacter odensis]MBK8534375.1 thiopurine S-methyltransferase [Candidatus Competibacteraceae bacterium]MBK8751843.1 thiopurine S-methyltransferase [Candidatus Competibacteraceae bacterium]CDH44545.1 Thiopurine S-methyltransferase [Candidatus Contendobacter odensis Run_B_J11]
MEPGFWHERWEKAEIGFHQQEINTHLRQFWKSLDLQPGQRVFVPLCGKSHDLLWLAGEGHPVTGVELSPIAIEAFFAENGLHPRRWQEGAFEIWEADEIHILCGDFFALESRHLTDMAGVYDRAALIALPPALRMRYARHLGAVLPAGIQMLLVTMEYDPSILTGPPFTVSEDEVRALYAPMCEVALLHTRDALSEESRWRDRGLTWLLEKVYRLTHRPIGSE